ncbi:class I adenylate-forming enzyme family protein [Desulfotignum balticum]|uniref:class I adenylate-forming enzyme family protein n=1 Tax=Desulfotignum balticum TaxID=115781 RepID=UPI0003F4FC81|nr:AMP-binding protein [Desulfotignum balticum]
MSTPQVSQWNIAECLRSSAKRFPDKVALKSKKRNLTYARLDNRTDQLARTLMDMGLNKGDKCAFMTHNSIETVEIFMGLAKTGIVGVPINFRNTEKEIQHLASHSEAKAFIIEDTFLDRISWLSETDIQKQQVLQIGGQDHEYPLYEKELSARPDTPVEIDIQEDDVWYIGYTSGTTDKPKGVETRHRALLQNATQWMADYGRYTEDDRFLLTMPLFHANAIMCSLLMIIAGGYTYINHSRGFNPEEILSLINREKITITSMVPTMLTLLIGLSEDVAKKYDRSTLQNILVASAPLWTSIKEGTLNFFKDVNLYEAYGSTEHQIVTVLKPKYQWSKIRSIGKPVIYKDVKILDMRGNECPPGVPGELFVRGWGIPLEEYYKDPEATRNAYREGWSTVSDIAVMDEEGFYYLVDRKHDMIISGGENVSPSELENHIVLHPAVHEAAVIGQPDCKWGEAITAVIVLKKNARATADEIQQFCRGKMAEFKVPKYVVFAEDLPKNATGKILRKKIREPFWKHHNEGGNSVI